MQIEFDSDTGLIYVTDGVHRRKLARINDHGEILIWWRTEAEKGERRIRMGDILKAILK